MRDVALALGSNMGDSAAILQGALDDLARLADLELIAVSHVFETDPVGGPEQPVYLNAVVVGRTALSGEDLLACTQDIEQAWDRVREVRWGPRTLDIDILSIDGVVCDTADLTLPHPRAHERGFAIVPWADVAPDAVIPGHGRVRDLLDSVDASGVRPTSVHLRIPSREDA
ncbi:MAG: 2-amino-4-hydroxy-6-hydroxymethyldihydropteridine diphosphokinase [Actinomycetes bacterium]